MPSTDHPPAGDESYGLILNYWLNTLGMSDRDLAEAVDINRTYPGQIKRGHKLPTSDIAARIRQHLVKTAQAPGRFGPPPLTAPERQLMDELLRTSFAREDQARRARHPGRHDESVADASSASATVVEPAHRRSINPIAAVCLVLLALGLPFAGVIYYVTHASAPLPARSTPAALTPQQLSRLVTTARPLRNDALAAPSANGWDVRPVTGDGGCAYGAGAYHATVLRRAVIQCLAETLPLRSSRTFAVQVDLTFVKGDGGAGLVFGYSGTAPYDRFVVRPDGYYDLYDPVTGTRVDFALPAPSDTQYRLTAIIRDTSIYLYINGAFMAQGTREPGVSVEGTVGVFAVDGMHNPTDVAFHNFAVWALT